ncbi:MAG: DUF4402 domain-containing protein, partial [Deltaproteobacteria bacterium]|nr:DUF4402 domain-containing protein [Deltaproteobacteria bacterium]
ILRMIFIGVILFALSASSLQAQVVTLINNLTFPTTEDLSAGQAVTVLPTDANAAVFTITGTPNTPVTISIVPSNNVNMVLSGGSKKIKIIDFTFGGSVPTQLSPITATLDATGNLSNLRLGATANVLTSTAAGYYLTSIALRVIY